MMTRSLDCRTRAKAIQDQRNLPQSPGLPQAGASLYQREVLPPGTLRSGLFYY